MIKVSIIENELEYAESLADFLPKAGNIEVLEVYPRSEDFFNSNSVKPDIFLIDLNLGQNVMTGSQFISKVREKDNNTLFLVLTIYDEDEKVFDALRAGANGYILKSAPIEGIANAIIELFEGGAPMSPQIARKVTMYFNHSARENQPATHLLTNRENEIIQMIAKGKMEKEVAYELFLSIKTVKNHISNIYQKLHVNTRVEALNKYYGR